jgi:hypothetical protein
MLEYNFHIKITLLDTYNERLHTFSDDTCDIFLSDGGDVLPFCVSTKDCDLSALLGQLLFRFSELNAMTENLIEDLPSLSLLLPPILVFSSYVHTIAIEAKTSLVVTAKSRHCIKISRERASINIGYGERMIELKRTISRKREKSSGDVKT